jgi:hypothetical protein
MPRKTRHLTSKSQFSQNFTLDSVADSNYRGKCGVGGFLIFEQTYKSVMNYPPVRIRLSVCRYKLERTKNRLTLDRTRWPTGNMSCR